jgi:hypothetical protein
MRNSLRGMNQGYEPQTTMLLGGRYQEKYFASNQAFIFIGKHLVDEAVACSYRFHQAKVPIYSYSSQYFDAVGSGKVILEGNLTINYIDTAYLYYALYHALTHRESDVNSLVWRGAMPLTSNEQIEQFTGKLSGSVQNANQMLSYLNRGDEYGKLQTLTVTQMKGIAQLVAADPHRGKEIMSTLRTKFWGADVSSRFHQDATKTSAFGANKSFDELQRPEGIYGRPDQLPPVNISINHGYPNNPAHSTFRILQEVIFTGVSQQLAPSGQPQTETYEFFARSLDM